MSNSLHRGENCSVIITREGKYHLTPYPDSLSRCKDTANNTLAAGSPPVRLSIHDCTGIDSIVYEDSYNSSRYFNENSCKPGVICCYNLNRDLYFYNISPYFSYLDKKSFKSPPTFHELKTLEKTAIHLFILIGLNNGEIHVICPSRKNCSRIYNEDKIYDKTAVTCVKWVRNSDSEFLVSHASGCLYLYSDCHSSPSTATLFIDAKHGPGFQSYLSKNNSKNPSQKWVFGCNLDKTSSQHTHSNSNGSILKNGTSTLNSVFSLTTKNHNSSKHSDDGRNNISNSSASNNNNGFINGNNSNLSSLVCDHPNASCINQFDFSPNGEYLAVVTQDGYLRVFEYSRMELYGFMRSYFGGLMCLDWSPDGLFIVVGGQDDLITLWSFEERVVICRGQGHRSWITSVRFDPTLCASAQDLPCNFTEGESSLISNPCLPHESSLLPKTRSMNKKSFSETSSGRVYRLGSVAQDTYLCLWEITEDVIRQGLRFYNSKKQEVILQKALNDLHKRLSIQGFDSSLDKNSLPNTSCSFSNDVNCCSSQDNTLLNPSSSAPSDSNNNYSNVAASKSKKRFSFSNFLIRKKNSESISDPLKTASDDSIKPGSNNNSESDTIAATNSMNRITGGLNLSCLKNNKNNHSRFSCTPFSSSKRSQKDEKNGPNSKKRSLGLNDTNDQKNIDSKIITNKTTLSDVTESSLSIKTTNISLIDHLISSIEFGKEDEFLLGSVACPQIVDVPMLESLVQTKFSQDRFTDITFRPDGIHTASQQGFILIWKRPLGLVTDANSDEYKNGFCNDYNFTVYDDRLRRSNNISWNSSNDEDYYNSRDSPPPQSEFEDAVPAFRLHRTLK